MTTLWERGAQNERTRLSWQRTLLSLTVTALVVARLVALRSVPAGVVVAVVAVGLAGSMALWSRRRYRAAGRALDARSPLPDGGVNLVLVLLVLTVGAGAVLLLALWV